MAEGRYLAAAGSRSRKITVMVMAAATPPVTRRVAAGTGNLMRRERATARTTMVPTSPTKLTANTLSSGTAASTASLAAASNRPGGSIADIRMPVRDHQ